MAESISQSLRSMSVAEVNKHRVAASSSEKKPHEASPNAAKFSPQAHLAATGQSPSGEAPADSARESIIESDYSQEFTEQSITSREVSQSQHTASKHKL